MSGAHIEKPLCIALLVCESVIQNSRTQNKSFIEAFNTMGAAAVPVNANRLMVVLTLTNVTGHGKFRLIINTPSGPELVRMECELTKGNPLEHYDWLFDLSGILLPEFGTYQINVHFEDEVLAGRPFTLAQMKPNR